MHRASDGGSVFVTRLEQPATAAQPVALREAGDRLAVLDGDRIRVFTVGAPAGSLAAR